MRHHAWLFLVDKLWVATNFRSLRIMFLDCGNQVFVETHVFISLWLITRHEIVGLLGKYIFIFPWLGSYLPFCLLLIWVIWSRGIARCVGVEFMALSTLSLPCPERRLILLLYCWALTVLACLFCFKIGFYCVSQAAHEPAEILLICLSSAGITGRNHHT